MLVIWSGAGCSVTSCCPWAEDNFFAQTTWHHPFHIVIGLCCLSWWKVHGVHSNVSWVRELDLLERIWIISEISSVLFFSLSKHEDVCGPVCKSARITEWILSIPGHSTSPLLMFLLIWKAFTDELYLVLFTACIMFAEIELTSTTFALSPGKSLSGIPKFESEREKY